MTTSPATSFVQLPDVAIKQDFDVYRPIDWVGMGAIQLPLMIVSGNTTLNVMSKIQVLVSLDLSPSRGIHMSRLYALIQTLSQAPLQLKDLSAFLQKLIASQNTQSVLSSSARLQIDLDLPLQRKSLKSGLQSWRVYPVRLILENKQDQIKTNFIEFKLLYSSTCPASAALARDLNSQHFLFSHEQDMIPAQQVGAFLNSEAGTIATPHAQRSEACVQLLVQDSFEFHQIADVIDRLEQALATPVQGAVKREDEQEFARLNGTHLMFCEDAVRILSAALDQREDVSGYRLQISHLESLHAHNAVSMLQKNFNFLI